MRLPLSGQVTLRAALVEKTVGRILSSRRINHSLKRSRPDRSGNASAVWTDEPSLQPLAKRQKQVSPLNGELDNFPSPNLASPALLDHPNELKVDDFPSLDPASPALLLDLPNELLQLILSNLVDSDLLSPALLFNRRLRANVAHTYLARAGIIENDGYIYIRDIVGRRAIVLLSTTPLFDEISLICDLFYIVEYGRHLRQLIAATPRVWSICIEFDERETELLHDTRTLEPLIAFLASLRDTCFSLQIQRSRSYFTPPTRSLTIPLNRPKRPICQLPTRGLLKGINSLTVSADFTRIPSLFGICRSIFIIARSQVEDFQLEDCSSQQDCDSILSLINFPRLRTLSIRSLSHVTISIKVAFFKQHSLVKTVFLFSNPLNGLTPTAPKSVLSLPPLTHLFLSANYRLLKLQDASFLQECFLQAPNIRPRSSQVEFCLNMNTLLAALASLSKYRFNSLKLVISLPSRIPDHIEQFLVHPEVQCLCRKPDAVRLSGVKTLEFMVDSFDYTIANRIADWLQICPDLSELHVKPQFISELDSQAIISSSQFNDFIMTCKVLLPNLSTIHCPAGVWKGNSRF